MQEIIKSVIFGIVEGITEWLPVSSTGHLILLNEYLRMDAGDAFYELYQVVIQLGAILAVVVLFFHRLNPFSGKKTRQQRQQTWDLLGKILVAVVPSAAVGLVLDDWMDAHFYNAWVVAATLILYGLAFILVERWNRARTPEIRDLEHIGYKTALGMGAFQVLSLIPGTSRSGSTILGGLLLGVSRVAASEFSFFMAIPTMLGASGLKLLKFLVEGNRLDTLQFGVLLVGSLVSFLVSLTVIRGLIRFVRSHSFASFGVYRIALGLTVLVWFLLAKTPG